MAASVRGQFQLCTYGKTFLGAHKLGSAQSMLCDPHFSICAYIRDT